MQETDNGIMIGTGTNRQWAFVKNSDQTGATGIAAQPATLSQQSSCCYTIDGQRMAQPKKGLNIIRMGDGTTKKVVVR